MNSAELLNNDTDSRSTVVYLDLEQEAPDSSARQIGKDWLYGLSLANLCHAATWSWLLAGVANAEAPSEYLTRTLPGHPVFAAVMLNTIILSVILGLAFHTVSHKPWRKLRTAGLVLISIASLIALNAFRIVASNQFLVLQKWLRSQALADAGKFVVVGLMCAVAGGVALMLWRWPQRLFRALQAGLIVLAPLAAMTLGQALFAVVRPDVPPRTDGDRAAPLAGGNHRRIIWLIFDELDYRLAFVKDERKQPLPELDRFTDQSFFADHAYPPARATLISLPSLIDGVEVTRARPAGTSTILLNSAGSAETIAWGSRPNVFTRARELGLNTSVVGWYHPYCRIFGATLTKCDWCEPAIPRSSMGERFSEVFVSSWRSLLETSLLSPFGQSLMTRRHIQTYEAFLKLAENAVVEPDSGLIFMHWPVPHAPFIYDRSTGGFTLANSPVGGYTDNLVLVDRSFAVMRNALEAAGMWEDSTILISADHPYRNSAALDGKSDDRIPFVLKLPGQTRRFDYRSSFNTVLSQGLLLAVARGEVRTGEDAARWLESHRNSVAPAGHADADE